MDERRKVPRSHLIHYLRIFDKTTGELMGNLVDISAGGLMLISESPISEPLQDNTTLQLRMDFPEELDGRTFVEFEARSVWCRVDINPDLFAIGMQIVQPQPEDLRMIERLIDMYRD
jgi:c-di-GMP-binding flagellar brake protein YcgR